MDGFEPNEGVIVLAATNRPDILDTALLRPGRFDRRIAVELPGVEARRAILEIHARGKPMADDVDLARVARSTPGFSGADLENLLNEAALLAARKRKERIEHVDIDESRDKILLGLEREGLAMTEEECRLLAFHEGGHAVVAAVLPHSDPVHKVTIVPRGRAMGTTQQLPEKDKYVYAESYIRDRMAVMMGGRAAEMLMLDTRTSGAEDDLKQVLGLARRMVLDWGMGRKLEHVALGDADEHVFLGQEIARRRELGDATAALVDEEIRHLVQQAFDRATETLREHEEGLRRVAEALIEEEEISGHRVLELLGLEEKTASAGGEGEARGAGAA
jgi:cell division protease FtsH